ncbi:MAG: hypothetical protein A3B53_02275 [Candidatus Levybacteria bacterium RIFCSPLOWO2_01_FULL_42_15]|nr:MAG: hypothetical protein A3B53_02275 [Candidatus Levybacteria bacterium RIFCSPLOWO2_01_FULL_42_15]
MKKATRCRCCGAKNLFLYLNLGKQPLANSYHKKEEKLQEYPLEVLLCQNCFHSMLSVVIKPALMFKNYLYVSGTTETFQNHCKELAKDAVARVKKKKIRVLDIACNDGTQLEFFKELGCDVYGVDPAGNLREITIKKNISVIVDYWSKKVAKKLGKKFNLITGTNVFAHVDRIDRFLFACFLALEDDGILILEFPYGNNMIKSNEFDTVYHEHLSYFLINSFAMLASRSRFHIVDLIQTPIHGGSIRFFLKKGISSHSDKVTTLIQKEKESGLFDIQTYKRFAKNVAENRNNLRKLVSDFKKRGERVIGYGASAKGNTMLNYFKLNLEYIVDDNPLKWGFVTPGRNISIESPELLQKEKGNLHIIIMSWNFYKEIVKKIKELRGKKYHDNAILYVPKVTLNPISQ